MKGIQDLFFFGDSATAGGAGAHGIYEISDHTNPSSPPYYHGQWCDGLVWAERFPQKLGVRYSPSHNFAVGGATTGTSNAVEVGLEMLRGTGMLAQVQRYVAEIPTAGSGSLHALWPGGNDVGDERFPTDEIVPRALGKIGQCVRLLSNAGARVVLVVTNAHIGCFPGAGMQGKVDLFDQLSRELRNGLVRMVQRVRTQLPTTIILGEIFELHEQVISHPGRYGFTNVTDMCVLRPTWQTAEVIGGASGHLYWDDWHFTAAFQALVADRLYDAVREGLRYRADKHCVYQCSPAS
jgi:phospholipase/lecithinase/hemolysin